MDRAVIEGFVVWKPNWLNIFVLRFGCWCQNQGYNNFPSKKASENNTDHLKNFLWHYKSIKITKSNWNKC